MISRGAALKEIQELKAKLLVENAPVRKIDMFYALYGSPECENLYRTDKGRLILEDFYND